MRRFVNIYLPVALLALTLVSIGLIHADKSAHKSSYDQKIADKFHKSLSAKKAQNYIDSMRPWLDENGYSTSLLFVADMDLNMNVKRFYAVNPDNKKLLNSFLVAHGSGGGSTIDNAVLSNVSGSSCTSEGKYRIGDSYMGNYGKGYRLHGLDHTNDNALKRAIVLHAYRDQTTEEYGSPNYFSAGCPMLAKESFAWVDSMIQEQEKPVVLVIYK
ncbi:MAG: murein L,D-transpeptidase catalytic domain family protein [Bacteroidia bacterium]|nr:murein L,D-transpeptidase catalytic domain family protein [Bacteroidia bacterium]